MTITSPESLYASELLHAYSPTRYNSSYDSSSGTYTRAKSAARRTLRVKIHEPKIEIYFISADQEQEIEAELTISDAMALYDKLAAALERVGDSTSKRKKTDES